MKRLLAVTVSACIVLWLCGTVLAQDEAKPAPASPGVSGQVDQLISQGGNFYSKGQYDKAIKMAEAALALDPGNKAAAELKAISQEGIKDRNVTDFVPAQRRTFYNTMRAVDRDMVGQQAIVKDGPNWNLVKRRTGGVSGPAVAVAAENRPIERKLDATKVTVDFKDARLAEVADWFANKSSLNVQVDPRVKVGDKAAADLTVTFKARDMSMRNALDWVTRFTNLKWLVRDQVVLITDRQHLDEFKTTAIYDVSDIVAEIPDYPSVPFFDMTLPSINARIIGDGFREAPDQWYRNGIGAFTGAYFNDYEAIPRYYMTEAEVRRLVDALIQAEDEKK